jgi:hypothetical protein
VPTSNPVTESSVVREPATVENCQADYASGGQARASLTVDAKKRFGTKPATKPTTN